MNIFNTVFFSNLKDEPTAQERFRILTKPEQSSHLQSTTAKITTLTFLVTSLLQNVVKCDMMLYFAAFQHVFVK